MLVRAFSKFIAGLSLFACASAFAGQIDFNVAGVQSNSEMFSSDNNVFNFNVGANNHVIGLSYNFNVTAFEPSYLSELQFIFSNSALTDGVIYTPGVGDDHPGTATYTDIVDLIAEGLDFSVGADGILRLEFAEDFSDELFPDGVYNFGNISFFLENDLVPPSNDVPEPGSVLLLGVGLAALGYTSRRRRAVAA